MGQNQRTLFQKIEGKYLLQLFCILPLFHLLLGIVMHQKFGYFYLTSKDPEYFHLISGIALSVFRLDPAYIDHPGIPIQIVIALAARITYFISSDQSIIHDVINDPELYVFAGNALYNVIFALIIFYTGIKAARYTKDIWAGLLIQLGFFSSMYLITVTGRLLPEGFMLLPLGLLILMMIKYLYDDHPEQKWKSYIILFSLLIGWGIATKLSFAPFILIPLLIIPGIKRKAAVVALTLLAFLIIAFPVLSHLDYFFKWTGNMFIHSGKWGHGESNFMDISRVPERILSMYKIDGMFFILMILALIASLALLFTRVRDDFYKRYLKTSFASILSLLLLIILISKHFAGHYFFPALVFKSFFIFLILLPVGRIFPNSNYMWQRNLVGVVIAFMVMVFSLSDLANSPFNSRKEHQLERIINFNSEIDKNDILIISAHYAGAPFEEYAIAGGMMLSGPAKKLFQGPMSNLYPNSYMYYGWSKKFFNWNRFVSSDSLVRENKNIYIYIGENKRQDLDKIMKRFRNENLGFTFKPNKVNMDKQFKDELFKLAISTKRT